MFKNKIILITGGTGSWGHELVNQLLLQNPEKIIIFSRGEIAQVSMEREYNNPKLKFIIGDVRDLEVLTNAMKGVHYVFHLAALKHVPICENMPYEAINTNIIGTKNVITACLKNKVIKCIDISTDKAVDPINVYGMSKAIGERLIIHANTLTNDTDFICIRGGNVLGSNGSVIPYIIKQIRQNNTVKINDLQMTRFFLPLKKAIELALFAVENGTGGETYVMRMPSFFIKDLIIILVEKFGDANTKVEIVGAREGEKIHEMLISGTELSRTTIVNGNYFVIRPEIKIERSFFKIWDTEEFKITERLTEPFTSDKNIGDINALRWLLKEGGFIQ